MYLICFLFAQALGTLSPVCCAGSTSLLLQLPQLCASEGTSFAVHLGRHLGCQLCVDTALCPAGARWTCAAAPPRRWGRGRQAFPRYKMPPMPLPPPRPGHEQHPGLQVGMSAVSACWCLQRWKHFFCDWAGTSCAMLGKGLPQRSASTDY